MASNVNKQLLNINKQNGECQQTFFFNYNVSKDLSQRLKILVSFLATVSGRYSEHTKTGSQRYVGLCW